MAKIKDITPKSVDNGGLSKLTFKLDLNIKRGL